MNFREFVNSDRKPQPKYKEPEELYENVDDDQEYIDEPEEPNDDFEDIEEFFAGVEIECGKNAPEYKINQLIKNQKKIIEMLKEDK